MVLDCLDMDSEDEMENLDIIRKKVNLTRAQRRRLLSEFKKKRHWTKKFQRQLAEELDLRLEKVYKWHYDQVQKTKKI